MSLTVRGRRGDLHDFVRPTPVATRRAVQPVNAFCAPARTAAQVLGAKPAHPTPRRAAVLRR